MQSDNEASTRCFQTIPHSLHYGGSIDNVVTDENSTHPGGGQAPVGSPDVDSMTPHCELFYGTLPQQDVHVTSSRSHINKQQQGHYIFESNTHHVHREYYLPYQLQYLPYKMYPHGIHQDQRLQEFQYFVVIDFEATCDKEKGPHPQEIIEFPSVLVNSMTGQVEDFFQIYVRPTCNQHLSDFCKELTGIQQIQVDKGVLLGDALLMHDRWLEEKGIKHTNFAVVTWTNWDCRVMLESECRFKRIPKPPYFNRWINLKVPFHEVFNGARCNLKEAVQMAGLAWEGRAHCGLDDAKNTARLLAYMMHRGFKFSITNSLVWQYSEQPFKMHQLMDHYSGPILHHGSKRPIIPIFQFHPRMNPSKDSCYYCYCGVKSIKRVGRQPGPKHGTFFFGCGNWTATRGALCPYFEWAT
ncbi:unnamed protein product [Rhodiola kirilowii]